MLLKIKTTYDDSQYALENDKSLAMKRCYNGGGESDKSLAMKRCYNGGCESDKSLAMKCCYNGGGESDNSLAIKHCYNGGDESDKSLATKAQFAFQNSVRNKMCKRSTAGESELAAVAPA